MYMMLLFRTKKKQMMHAMQVYSANKHEKVWLPVWVTAVCRKFCKSKGKKYRGTVYTIVAEFIVTFRSLLAPLCYAGCSASNMRVEYQLAWTVDLLWVYI